MDASRSTFSEHDVEERTYEALLFDMDGVIVDTERAVAAFWQVIANRYGSMLTEAQLTRHVYGRPANETLDALFPAIGESERHDVLQEMVRSEESDTYHAIPGALNLLHALHSAGIPMALVTSGDPEKVAAVERQMGLETTFAVHVTARDVERGKPDPECYRLGARRLGVSPSECIVFEDAVSGAHAAIAAGTRCIGIALPERETALHVAGVRDVIPDFTAAVLHAESSDRAARWRMLCLSHRDDRMCLRLENPVRT